MGVKELLKCNDSNCNPMTVSQVGVCYVECAKDGCNKKSREFVMHDGDKCKDSAVDDWNENIIIKNTMKLSNIKSNYISDMFSDFRESIKKCGTPRIEDSISLLEKKFNFDPRIAVFGGTGSGKSTLLNIIFGDNIAETRSIGSCTREPNKAKTKQGITVIDFPGLSENKERHDEYVRLYKESLKELDLVLWVLSSKDKKLKDDKEFYLENLKSNTKNIPVIFVVSHVDIVGDPFDWDRENSCPGESQKEEISKLVKHIANEFEVDEDLVIPVCGIESKEYNITLLIQKILEILPNEKKVGFGDNIREEKLNEESKKQIKKGFLEAVGEWFLDVTYDIVEGGKELVSKAVEKLKETYEEKKDELASFVIGVIIKKWFT